jgi:DNA-binding NarL/FixJ family response regulator
MPDRRETRELRCVVVDDHPAVLAAVRPYLERNGLRVMRTASTIREGTRAIVAERPDVAVVDLRLPDGSGLELARATVADGATRVVLYTGGGDATTVGDGLRLGVNGFVRKNAPLRDLVRAIHAAASNTVYIDPELTAEAIAQAPVRLSAREQAVLQHVADGQSYAATGASLGIGAETVKTHLKNAFDKLGAETRTQAVAEALRRKLIA